MLPLLLLSLAPLPAPAASQETGDPLEGLDAYVRRAVADWEVPGLAVAVVKDGELAFVRGYGTRELGADAPVDGATLFAIGSTTKAMTAAAVGMLVDEGKLAWDEPVVDVLPWFRLEDPWVTREVTVRDLLTHRAGLGNADFLWYGQGDDLTTEEIVRKLRHVEAAYSLRSGFVYQNIMYAAAGEVVETASGMPWDAFVETRIFGPLGMERSVTTLADARERSNVARPHDVVDGELRVIENATVDPVRAAGSVWSGVEDMSRWLRFLLRGCRTPAGDALLEPETCRELFRPQAIVRDGFYPTARLTEPHWTTYGLGWFQQDYEGRKVDFHTGSIDGMVAIAGLVRDEGLGVYVLGNRDHAELRHALMLRVFDLYDDDAPRDWSAELRALYDELGAGQGSARQAAEARRVEGTEPSLPLERYAGVYQDPLYGTAHVALTGNGDLRLRYGAREGVLEHWHYDTFRVAWDRAWHGTQLVTFVLDARGRPRWMRAAGMELERRDETGPSVPGWSPDWDGLAELLLERLALTRGERVLLLGTPGRFTPLVTRLREGIRAAGATDLGALSGPEDPFPGPVTEFVARAREAGRDEEALRSLHRGVDVAVNLPGADAAPYEAMQDVLREGSGRTVHFHWSGAYELDGRFREVGDRVSALYQRALLETDYARLARDQRALEEAMRGSTVRVTTPAGTDLRFRIGDRPVTRQDGDASAVRADRARNLIDREVELPAGAVRVAPLEESVEGVVVFPVSYWSTGVRASSPDAGTTGDLPGRVEGLILRFREGRVVGMEAERGIDAVEAEMEAAGAAARAFREFALGMNPLLAVPEEDPFIPYYGYGAGVVRLSLGDNTELGGAVGGGYVRWNFFTDATVVVGDRVWVRNGELLRP